MDFITHSLVGAGIARVITRDPARLPQRSIAVVLGSTLMDGDSCIAWFGQNYYGRYHRVATHSILGLAVMALLAATIAWWLAAPPRWRRFGWFVSNNLDGSQSPPRERWAMLHAIAALAAAAHWVGDWITGYGNMIPLWPWTSTDVSLRAVNSFDWVLFSGTLACHVAMRARHADFRASRVWMAAWFCVCAGYVSWRVVNGPAGIW